MKLRPRLNKAKKIRYRRCPKCNKLLRLKIKRCRTCHLVQPKA
jgi:hypothetical protein